MLAERRREIVDWTIDLPPGWFRIPLDDLDARAQSQWIDEVVAGVEEEAVAPGSAVALRDELAALRASLLQHRGPSLGAAVSIRPQTVMTIGCVLLTSVLRREPDDDPDAFERLLEDGFAHPARGLRTHSSTTWRDRIDAGELVGSFQRFELVEFGEGIGEVEDRTIFGLFPEGAGEMIRIEFRVQDLATYPDMIGATSDIVRTARVTLAEPS